jgi:hypothetical protein
LIINIIYSQNKKEQIVALNYSIDSLNSIISNERNNVQNKIKEIDLLLNSNRSNLIEISDLKKEIDDLKRLENQNRITILNLRKQNESLNINNKLKNCIVIHADEQIKGFDLTIYFYPKYQLEGLYYRGYSVFNFYRNGKVKSFSKSSFTLPLYSAKGIDFSEDSLVIMNCPYQEIIVQANDLPISLEDINFDGNDELILHNFGYGVNAKSYLPFEIINDELSAEIYDISDKFPEFYNGYYELDKLKKEITFFWTDHQFAYFDSYKVVFKSNGDWEYKLIKYYKK